MGETAIRSGQPEEWRAEERETDNDKWMGGGYQLVR